MSDVIMIMVMLGSHIVTLVVFLLLFVPHFFFLPLSSPVPFLACHLSYGVARARFTSILTSERILSIFARGHDDRSCWFQIDQTSLRSLSLSLSLSLSGTAGHFNTLRK